jgi:hypothetical protein
MICIVSVRAWRTAAGQSDGGGMSRFAGYRQKRSTPATRVLGSLACCALLVTLVWKLLFYWASVPRWDLITLLALTSVLTIAWAVASVRAPAIPRQDVRPGPETAGSRDGSVPPLPSRIPAPRDFQTYTRYYVLVLLIGPLTFMFALFTAMGPTGDRGRVAARIAGAGGIVGDVKVVQTIGQPFYSGNVKSGLRCNADLVVSVPSPHWPATVTVPDALLSGCPNDGDEIKAYYAPDAPQAGIAIHTSIGETFDGKPGIVLAAGAFPVCLGLLFAGLITVGAVRSHAGTRLLREDVAHRRVRALRATLDSATRAETLQSGRRLGSEKVTTDKPSLRLRVRGGGQVDIGLPQGVLDPSVVVDDFAGAAGWLCWPRRYQLFRGTGRSMPFVFVADDGRVLWSWRSIDSSRYDSWSSVADKEDPRAVAPFASDAAAAEDARNRPPLRTVVYGTFHPVLHLPAAACFAVGLLSFLIRLAINPDTLTSWVLGILATAAVGTGTLFAVPELVGVKRAGALFPTIKPTVVDQLPR